MKRAANKLVRVDELDGIRGVLAFWVALSHIVCLTGMADLGPNHRFSTTWKTLVYAQPAVETFIILSGFAISFLLDARPQSYREFITGRIFRIIPVYLVSLLIGTLVASLFTPWLLSHTSWKSCNYFNVLGLVMESEKLHLYSHILAHFLLLHGAVPNSVLPYAAVSLLPPAWSISLEWQYYLLAPLIARLVRSNLAIILMILFWLVMVKEGGAFFNTSSFLPARLDLFLVGIGSFHLYALWSETNRQDNPWSARLVACALAATLIVDAHSVALCLWVIVFGATFISGRGTGAWCAKGLRSFLLHPFLQHLGRWSYPLYLIHWPLIVLGLCFIVHKAPQISGSHAQLVLLVAGMPIIVAASALLHYAVERPGMRLGQRLTRRKPVSSSHSELRKID